MYQTALTSRRQILRRNQNTARYQPIARALGPISNGLFVAMLVAVLGLMYLTQITKTSGFGYEVDELKTRRSTLVAENKQLEVEASRLQTLERIQGSSVAKSLEDISSVDFAQ
jgi:hypothetical protein